MNQDGAGSCCGMNIGRLDVPRSLIELDKADCAESLAEFVRHAWHVIEPGQPYVHGWHIDFMCLPADAELQTREGTRTIGDVVESGWDGEVLSFNHKTGKTEWRRILARMKNPARPLYTLTVDDTTSLAMTGDHPVFVSGIGYVPAADVKKGQNVIQLQVLRDGVQPVSGEKHRRVLQQGLFCGSPLQAGNARVLDVRRRENAGGWERLHFMQTNSVTARTACAMRALWNIGLLNAFKTSCLLWFQMHWPWQNGGEEPGVYRRKGSCSIHERVSESGQAHQGARWPNVLSVFGNWKFGRSPYRSGQIKQRGWESGSVVQNMPQQAEREAGASFGVRQRTIIEVTPSLLLPDFVYNVEVEGNNNYFANGILVHNCAHLEAITDGVQFDDGTFYNRLLINVPPGAMKSLLTSVFWPAWVWGPRNEPHKRFLCASHSQGLAIRDSTKMRRLIVSDWYQARWGDRFKLTGDQNAKTKFENTATGFREAIAAGSITGARGDIVIIDDPHSVESAASDAERANTLEWFTEAVPNRMNNPERSAIVVIMQRLHQEDVSGIILDRKLGYDHVMLPMRYDPGRAKPTMLGLEDPRSEEGELLFPARFPLHVVDRDEGVMGPYATASQHQQTPEPRGGGIIKRDWWQRWEQKSYPPFDYILASLDTAYTTKEENDPSAMTVWGIWSGGDQKAQITRAPTRDGEMQAILDRQYNEERPKVMLMYAWAERLELHDLVNRVRETMLDYSVDKLLIENKASGLSVAQEIRRVYGNDDFGVQLVDPRGQDKMARLYSVQHIFADGLVHAPPKQWAEAVINQVAQFPRAKHDDLADCVSMALKHLREIGLLVRGEEHTAALDSSRMHHGAGPGPLYPV